MLRRSLLALRPRPSALAARAVCSLSLSHVSALLLRNPQSPTVLAVGGSCSFAGSSEVHSTDSALDKFLKSVKLLDAAVGERDLAGVEPLLLSMDKVDANSSEEAQKELFANLETFSRQNAPGWKNSAVQLTLARSVADFYRQKLQHPELAVTNYLEALEVLPSLAKEHEDVRDCQQVELLSNVVKCYSQLGREADAETYFQKTITAHEQHRQRRGLSSASDIDANFHKKLKYQVLDLQLRFMEKMLAAKRWDEVRVLLENVVEQIEDSPHLGSPDKLAEIQVVINKSVEWLAAAEMPKPRITFGITRSPRCAKDSEKLLGQRRMVNKLWGFDPEDGVKLQQREKALLDEFAEKSKSDNEETETMEVAISAYSLLKTKVPSGCGTCTMALMIASKHFAEEQYSSALTYYLEALEIFASTPSDQIRREWDMAWVEREVMHVGALCAVASCYQKLDNLTRANVYFVQARDAYTSVCNRVHSRDPTASMFVDERALCPSTDDEERLLSGLALTVASTLVDYAENLASQKDWAKAKASTDCALELARGCSISLHHIRTRVDRIMHGASD